MNFSHRNPQFSKRRASRTWASKHGASMAGMSRAGMLFFLAIIGSFIWAGFQIIPFYYDYYELEGQAYAQANKASLFTDAQIHKELSRWIRIMGIPVNSVEDLKINRFDKKIFIELDYTEVLEFELFGKYYEIWRFPFQLRVEKEY